VKKREPGSCRGSVPANQQPRFPSITHGVDFSGNREASAILACFPLTGEVQRNVYFSETQLLFNVWTEPRPIRKF